MSAGGPGKALAIAGVALRRFFRDRTNLFFSFVFPVALILVIGLQFGEDADPRLGLVDEGGPELAAAVRAAVGDGVEVVEVAGRSSLADQVGARRLDAGLVVVAGADDEVAGGRAVELPFLAATTTEGQQLRTVVDQALVRTTAVAAAVDAARDLGAAPGEAAEAAARLDDVVDRVEVRAVTTGDRIFPEGTGGYDVAAPSQLVLFMFVTGLSGSYALIQSRQLGVARRMMSTPTSLRAVVAGEALGRLAIVVVQGLYVLVATLVLFGVDWGDPVGALAVLGAFGVVAAGAAMCFGAFFSNPDQASGIGTVSALVLAALGGAMLPIELFSDALARVARFTPHYWAIDAYATLVRHDGSVLDVGPQLAVLLGFGVVLVLVASWRMRVVLSRG
ncbi:MAG: ABC transporter permease [Acidimicrobiia bacterium]